MNHRTWARKFPAFALKTCSTCLQSEDEQVASSSLEIDHHIGEDYRNFQRAFADRDALEALVEKELIGPFEDKPKKPAVSTASSDNRKDQDPLRVPRALPRRYRGDDGSVPLFVYLDNGVH